MKKENPVQRFFHNYPVAWPILAVLAVALGAGYLFKFTHIVSAKKSEVVPIKVTSRNGPSLGGLPKTPSLQGDRRGAPLWAPDDLKKRERSVKIVPVKQTSHIGQAQGPAPTIESQLSGDDEIKKPRIVFVIDDLGYNKRQAELLFSIDRPLTIAILPRLTYSRYFCTEGKKHGFEIILHQPLEPETTSQDPGPGLIKTDMDAEEITNILEENLFTVPNAVGMNNHMGSRATKDRTVMYLVAKKLKERNLFFLDSMTHPQSVAHKVTFALGIPTLKRDVFIDNEDNYQSVSNRIQETAEVAKENGKAVAIGHIRENTLKAIKDSIPNLEAEGFEIVTLGKLLENEPPS